MYRTRMSLIPTRSEIRARALTDLRMGLPVVVGKYLIFAVETLTPERLGDIADLPHGQLAITDWRARTLNIPVYDGNIARIALPQKPSLRWLRAVADPTHDLSTPLKGPFTALRTPDDGAVAACGAIALAKAAHLLPAVVLAPADGPCTYLTHLNDTDIHDLAIAPVAAAALPLVVQDAVERAGFFGRMVDTVKRWFQ